MARFLRESVMGMVAATFILGARQLSAQTHDDPRLIIGISAGEIGSRSLWVVPMQPVYSDFEDTPTEYRLSRSIQSDITMAGSATYFRNPHFGLTGEFVYLGMGTTAGCQIAQDDGDPFLENACAGLNGTQVSASVTAAQAGVVYRFLSHTLIQPYIKAVGGVAFTPSSTVETVATAGFIGDTADNLTIYTDPSWKTVRGVWTAGFGISTAPSSGYQIHAEVRETWIALPAVTGATQGQGFPPPTASSSHNYLSVLVGFDVVLEQRHGRRY